MLAFQLPATTRQYAICSFLTVEGYKMNQGIGLPIQKGRIWLKKKGRIERQFKPALFRKFVPGRLSQHIPAANFQQTCGLGSVDSSFQSQS
jgi:hypothetical protein